jgi:hypothetical protein
VISRALVASKGKTYVVKISFEMPVRLSALLAAVCGAALPMAACPMPTISRIRNPRPPRPAQSRCPRIVSTRESDEVTPISMTTKRNSISTAPVYTMICTKARNGAPCIA